MVPWLRAKAIMVHKARFEQADWSYSVTDQDLGHGSYATVLELETWD